MSKFQNVQIRIVCETVAEKGSSMGMDVDTYA
jgi:hypothetical protein